MKTLSPSTTSKCGTTGRWLLRFHHILDLSSHEDCNCNFWKSQKLIEPGVCVGSEFLRSSSSWWYPWTYPTIYTVGRRTMTATREFIFFLKKKKKKKKKLSLKRLLFSYIYLVLLKHTHDLLRQNKRIFLFLIIN